MKRFIIFLITAYLTVWGLLWVSQDILLFPLLKSSLFSQKAKNEPPQWIDRFSVTTYDNQQLDVWTTYGKSKTLDSGYVALIFHGNGETVADKNFLPFFARHRIPAFTFDYRGYGNSTGWPTEERLLKDTETVWQAIQQRTGVSSDKVILLGNSIGSGLAGYLASKINPHTLILIAGYSSLHEVVSDSFIYRWFPGVLRYNFPNVQYLSEITSRCVILAHGKLDPLISYRHLDLLKKAIKHIDADRVITLSSETASHNDIYYAVESKLDQSLEDCLHSNTKSP